MKTKQEKRRMVALKLEEKLEEIAKKESLITFSKTREKTDMDKVFEEQMDFEIILLRHEVELLKTMIIEDTIHIGIEVA